MLAIGAIEHHASLSQTIKVRRLDCGVAVAAQFGTKVIDNEKEDVEFFVFGMSANSGSSSTAGMVLALSAASAAGAECAAPPLSRVPSAARRAA